MGVGDVLLGGAMVSKSFSGWVRRDEGREGGDPNK